MKKLTFISCILLGGWLSGATAADKPQPVYCLLSRGLGDWWHRMNLGGWLSGATAADKPQPVYKSTKAPIEKRVNDLVGRMTLEEKIQQLSQYTLGLSLIHI